MACTTGCPTQDCESYAVCLRGKGARVAWSNEAGGLDYTRQKKWDNDLAAYRDAKSQGVQPAGTQREQVERAMKISDAAGQAYQA